jgi:hypothetical protein
MTWVFLQKNDGAPGALKELQKNQFSDGPGHPIALFGVLTIEEAA